MKYPKMEWGRMEAVINKLGGEERVDQFLAGKLVVVGTPGILAKAKSGASRRVLANLLEEVGEPAKLPAVKRFVAREKFIVDCNGELPISFLGSNFQENFLDVVEENVRVAILKQRKLLKPSVDTPILAALGDPDLQKIKKAKVALAHVFHFLKTADRSKWFVFYVADAKGNVWTVLARWFDVGWFVYANAVSYPYEWFAGIRVVSR